MANEIIHRQRLRGSSVQNNEYTGLEGEITIDLTNHNLRLHDGTQLGGVVIPNFGQVLPIYGGTLRGLLTFSNGKTIDDYLPLSGGTVGQLISTASSSIVSNVNTSRTAICGGMTDTQGAYIALCGKDRSGYPGYFSLNAQTSVSDKKVLEGRPDGTLTWAGKDVERVNTISTNYIRYEGGLQIVWGECNPTGYTTSTSNKVTFPVAFSTSPHVVIGANANSGGNIPIVGWETVTSFTCGARGGETSSGMARYIAIGKWK